MKKNTIRYALLLIGIAIALTADVAAQQSASWPLIWIQRSMRSGADFTLTNDGRIALDTSKQRMGFVNPRGSGFSYLFGGGLWFGTVRQRPEGAQTLVFSTYNPSTGWSNATPGDVDSVLGAAPPSVYSSANYDRQGLPTIDAPRWPLWFPGRPDTTSMMNSGTYVADPFTRSSTTYKGGAAFTTVRVPEQMFSRFNDMTLRNYEDGPTVAADQGYPIGLQVEQNVYTLSGTPVDGAVVIRYDIVNISSDTLRHCVIGQVSDPDLGYGGNDHLAFYADNAYIRTVRLWTDTDHGDTNYNKFLAVLIEAPVSGSDGYIDNSLRETFEFRGLIGVLSRWTGDAGPKTSRERYDAMTLPDWSADTDSGPADQRMVMASDTFSMRPGDTAHFAIGYIVVGPQFGKAAYVGEKRGSLLGNAGSVQSFTDPNDYPVEPIDYPIEKLIEFYYEGTNHVPSLVESPDAGATDAASDLAVVPNPAGDHASLSFSLPTTEEVTLRIVDALGRTVGIHALGMLEAGTHRYPLDVAGLRPGKYLVSLETPTARRVAPLTLLR